MRSFAVKAAMAAVFVSTALTGAFAASGQYPASPMPQATHAQIKPVATSAAAAPTSGNRTMQLMNAFRLEAP